MSHRPTASDRAIGAATGGDAYRLITSFGLAPDKTR